MRDACSSTTASTAKKKRTQLASWLESNGEDSAAASLREGLDETLTVMRLNLPSSLRRSMATTNAIENMNGSLRPIARNVKRWKDESMIRRWVALGIAEAQRGFRRIKGYKNVPSLLAALRPTAAPVALPRRSRRNLFTPGPLPKVQRTTGHSPPVRSDRLRRSPPMPTDISRA